MNNILIMFLMLILAIPVFASGYNVHRSEKLSIDDISEDERILFILDYSNSMSEYLEGDRKSVV